MSNIDTRLAQLEQRTLIDTRGVSWPMVCDLTDPGLTDDDRARMLADAEALAAGLATPGLVNLVVVEVILNDC